MTLQAQLLDALALYGLPALFTIILAASIGAPLPSGFLLLVVGSFVAQGEMAWWPTVSAAAIGAIVGDHIGFALGRWGGRSLALQLTERMGATTQLQRAEAAINRWGGLGVFLTRWLITPIGPWVNLTTGMIGYRWPLFSLWDIVGEVLWVVLYVWAGTLFYNQIEMLSGLLGDLSWLILGALAAGFIGWRIFRNHQNGSNNVTSVDQSLNQPTNLIT